MIYLSGRMPRVRRPDLGFMLNPQTGNRIPDGMAWAFENGCYGGTPERWLQRLPRLVAHRARCLFTPLPDVVGDARATWDRWQQYFPQVRHLGFRLAYVSQDGETRWPEGAQCLFVGGTTHWKLSEASYALVRRARMAGLWVHMGRVNSLRRLTAAWLSGFNSADGTFTRRGIGRREPELCGWLDYVNGPQQRLGLFA